MKCKCDHSGQFPLQGEGFSRRNFLQVAGTSLVASYFADVVDPRLLLADTTTASVPLRNTAKSVIFIFTAGAMSQIDTFDLKEGSWTPTDLQPTSMGGIRWPNGLLPKTGEHLSKLAIVRCGLAWAAVHQLGQVWTQIARNPGGATGAIAPHMGAVVSLESQAKRTLTDVLPGFIALNSGAIPTSGYLPAKYAPFGVQTAASGLTTLSHPDGNARFTRRWDFLQQLDKSRATAALGKPSMDMKDFYDQSKTLMESPGINELFSFSENERARYGSTVFGDSLIVARNLVAANKGTRFVQTTIGGWDHHADIYNRQAAQSIYAQCAQFDSAFGALLTDLTTLGILNDVLVVVIGEFGRTVGVLNNQRGRDHYLRNSMLFAGGGTAGGRVIGRTDDRGDKVLEYQWKANRDVRPEDVTCTIYSALGIDYTTVRNDDPLGRGFEYVPDAKLGHYEPIEELF
jgi:Protein of unknown function (DUF1501)